MKKFVLMFTMFLAFTAISIAQTTDAQPSPTAKTKKGKGKVHSGMAKDLNLSADQKSKMKDIRNTFKGKMQAIRSDKASTKEQKAAQMKELGVTHDAEMKGLLSADQYIKWTAAKAQMKENHKNHKGKTAGSEGVKN